VSRGGVVRVPCGSGEDEGGHLARRTEEVGAGDRAARQGWARAGEGSKQGKHKAGRGATGRARGHSAPL
jgi:hypothetical protein